jgi:hypothetical protein
MSVSPSLPPAGPSVAELLLTRAFARPPQPFVDADVILALSAAAQEQRVVAAPPEPRPAPRLDVRA